MKRSICFNQKTSEDGKAVDYSVDTRMTTTESNKVICMSGSKTEWLTKEDADKMGISYIKS